MRVSTLLTVLSVSSCANAFTTPVPSTHVGRVQQGTLVGALRAAQHNSDNINNDLQPMVENCAKATIVQTYDPVKMSAMTVGFWALTSQISAAAGPDWGLFEGRFASLLHPFTMGTLLLFSIYTAVLGFQWRRQRTIGDEITALKKTMPDLNGAKSVNDAISAATEAGDVATASALQSGLSIEQQVKDLQAERKELSAKGPRDQHFNQGALLVFVGTAFAIEGPLNTYARAGKLFPGPHLYAGAGVVVLWALASAMVPYMSKGSDTARTIHISANLAGLGLFGWQVVSGLPILWKVIEKTSWP